MDILKIDRVGRNDNFFMLGGHSLLSVQMIERLRRIGFSLSVRSLFDTPTLKELAQSLNKSDDISEAPENLIKNDTTKITPELLPLIDLTQNDIDVIVNNVEGGASNIQDIYALSPLQDGILFHHIMATKGDPYLLVVKLAFDNREILDKYLGAVQTVIDRHDILRTSIMWENLSSPAQVVVREARLSVTELSFDPTDGSIMDQITKLTDPQEHRIDLTQGPLIQFFITQDIDGRWIAIELMHHIIGDHSTLELMDAEIKSIIQGQIQTLAQPQPYRNLIAQIRSGPGKEVHEQFFTKMLAEIDTPALPYGLSDTHNDGVDVAESHLPLSQELNDRLRGHAKRMGVSLASLCHLAWAQVISRTSGEEKVVFGTVLFGRMQGGSGSDHVMGMFINTLPIRIDIGSNSVEKSVRQTQTDLAALLEHEHASLALAQRCSSIPTGTPLFSSLLNYRHNAALPVEVSDDTGIHVIEGQERSNYPFDMSIEDGGDTLGLTAQIVKPYDPVRICEYMQLALESLAEALDEESNKPIRSLTILPSYERELLLNTWNATEQDYPRDQCIHHSFESFVLESPDACAVVFEDQSLTYAELNERSNRLAHQLIELGVKPDMRVALCVNRSLAMIVGLMAILKAGGAYVPLDPAYPSDRLAYMLVDAEPVLLLADRNGRNALKNADLESLTILDPNYPSTSYTSVNPVVDGLSPQHLAYIIYTSGSTGKPKGVMTEHRGVVNQISTRPKISGAGPTGRVLQFSSLSFDGSADEIFSALCYGGSLYIPADETRLDRVKLWKYLDDHSITQAELTPTFLQDCGDFLPLKTQVALILGGEALPPRLLRALRGLVPNGSIVNAYGPTETTIEAVVWKCPENFDGDAAPIGRPLANKKIYILDPHMVPVPIGVVGELYIGGVGVARGYLNRPELTDKVFLPDPFSSDNKSRIYKTGDLVRYLPDGNVLFLGRNDHQVKIRGFRIELEEIEARLVEHPLVRDTVVLALGEGDSKRLVAYVTADPTTGLAHMLRTHISTKVPDYMVPAAFVRLDELPLNPNGKLDRRALPMPDMDSFVSQEYEAPQGEIEFALAGIWAEVLKIDRVGRRDNFFMLGGHSLLAVKLTGLVRSRLNLDLRLQTLFEAPTIAELVPKIVESDGGKGEHAFDVLLPLRREGDRYPLFCIHPVFGLSWSFIGLLKHLHAEQPLYALQSRGFNGDDQPASSIDEIVSDYIEQIVSVQPHGPYHLVGWSFGGSIAHSIAVKLESLGKKVSLLALMDSQPDYNTLPEEVDADQEADAFVENLARTSDTNTIEEGSALWEKARHVLKNNIKLTEQYSASTFTGDMVFFSATESELIIDPSRWKKFTVGKIEVHQVKCGHLEMDKPSPMSDIGNVLAVKLEESYQRRNEE
ncbi:hypothetical protein BGZ46_009381 [Entomortierella lignicola]|nr:hypothetical protein BGZ46_009381 [Entomortierella lignicola]